MSFKQKLAEAVISALKSDKSLAERKISQKTGWAVGQEVFNVLLDTLKESGRVAIPNFGVFIIKQRSARLAVNPRNLEAGKIKVPPKKVIRFKMAKALEEEVSEAPLPLPRGKKE